MSFWEYEAGRKTCLRNALAGDFSNFGTLTKHERAEVIKFATMELGENLNPPMNGHWE